MKVLRYVCYLFALVFTTTSAFAQQRDTTVRNDTTTRKDTTSTPPVFAQDSVHPIPQLARFNLGPANGFSDGVYYWDRDAFHNEAAVTLGQILERIPGILILRTGLYVQPEAASIYGSTANRVEVWMDGYVLDPIMESTYDLSKVPLAYIESVRVERRLNKIRMHIETLMPRDNRPYSRIEAGVGQPNANMFRGLFSAPHLVAGPLNVAIDRIDTNGTSGAEPANQTSGWLKYSFIRKGSGVQVEYQHGVTTRNPSVPWYEKYTRDDVIVRGRLQIREGVVAELFGGRANVVRDTMKARADTSSVPKLKDDDTQFGGRLAFESKFAWAWASARLRDNPALPSSQIDASGGLRYNLISATADITQSNWRDAGNASEITLRAEAGPFRGVRVFGETTTSNRGAPFLNGLPGDSDIVVSKYTGYRAGAQINFRGINVGAAALHVKNDSIPTFGLPFDRTSQLYGAGEATGVEVSGSVPLLLLKGLVAEGNLTNWQSCTVSIYLPCRLYRAGLEYHAIPLKSGNLEILGRIEAIQRGAMFAPTPTDTASAFTTMPAISWVDAYLQIRIIDVRAWIRMEDLQSQIVNVLPNRVLRGARMIYGVKWQFFN